MAVIEVNKLQIGTTSKTEYLSRNGKVLINKGVVLTETIVDALKRRGITELFVQEADEEIKKILSTNITGMEDLLIDEMPEGEVMDEIPETSPVAKSDTKIKDEPPAKAINNFAELKNITNGEEGFKQILQTKKVKEIENKIDNIGSLPDRPMGESILSAAKEIKVEERTKAYKISMVTNYDTALLQTKTTLENLREGLSADGKVVQNLVEAFVDTYVTDRNILLNLAGMKSKSDDYLFNHCLNVCLLSINIAAAAGYSKRQIVEIGMGALLHDIGMMMIPQYFRFKKGPLTPDEFYEVRKHPILGLHMLERIDNLPDSVSYVAYQCHEREDGNGYPKGRSGRFLHYYAKIVMIADVFEALSSNRAYRSSNIPYKAMEHLLALVRKGLFKTELVKAFIDYTSLFPVGSLVRLSTNEIAKVVKANGKDHTRPYISIIADSEGNLYQEEKVKETDLSKQKDIKVVQALGNEKMNIDVMKGF